VLGYQNQKIVFDLEHRMIQLSEQKISATPKTASKLSRKEQVSLLKEIPCWQVNRHSDQNQLERDFVLKNFQSAIDFSNKITVIAEESDHHPTLLVQWGKVKVIWWSHSINGLHLNDFVMAAKTDEIFKNS
jgi:4a-hydroxytetrahydrobiopterin dehydratase